LCARGLENGITMRNSESFSSLALNIHKLRDKSDHAVTSIKQSLVLRCHSFLFLS
jgi:hypothetical protein